MNRTLPAVLLAVTALVLPVGSATAKTNPMGTYTGEAAATSGSVKYGAASFTIKNRKLVAWSANGVARQCKDLEMMNYGFTVASNVLKAYGLKAKDVKLSKQGRLKFTYKQPNHVDKITVDVKFGAKKAAGTIVNTAGPGEPAIENCSGSAEVTLKK